MVDTGGHLCSWGGRQQKKEIHFLINSQMTVVAEANAAITALRQEVQIHDKLEFQKQSAIGMHI